MSFATSIRARSCPKDRPPRVGCGISRRRGLYDAGPEVPTHISASLIEHELALIHELAFEPYFLTVQDIVAFARGRGILCQGRGSAANSVVCYCLDVTEVDPARMATLFERFISKEQQRTAGHRHRLRA